MALPVTIPNTFANATSSIPLSQLDTNFSTLANAVNGLNSGSETLANLKATTANVGVLTVTGNATIGDASTDTVTLNSTLTANTAVIFAAGTSAAPSITTTGDLNTGIFFPAADTIAFAEGGAEAMRIDSDGDVGIGTTSPGATLHLLRSSGSTTQYIDNSTTNGYSVLQIKNTGASGRTYEIGTGGSAVASEYAGNLYFYDVTAATNRMTLNSSGNLGLGVTPSAWSGGKAVEVGFAGRSLWGFTQAVGYETTNAYYNSGFKYGGTGAATAYAQDTGSHIWYTASSGTAGNAITFTQTMTLDASGNLGIGQTSMSQPLEIKRGSGVAALIEVAGNNNTPGSTSAVYGQDSSGNAFAWNRANLTFFFGTNNTERARIPAAGGFQCVNSISVGNATPTTSGAGITFPATQSASSDANTLDDYEEGTFTVTATPATSGTITVEVDRSKIMYTKVGRVVYISGGIQVAASSPVGTSITFGGLPFAKTGTGSSPSQYAGFTSSNNIFIDSSDSFKRYGYPVEISDAGTSTQWVMWIDASTVQTDDRFYFNFFYVTP